MNNFKLIVQRYKSNTATEEESKYIEEEIEKNILINELIDEKFDKDLDIFEENVDNEKINSKSIKRAVNKKWNKIIAISVILVFITFAFSKYILSPIVSNFYYNPEAVSTGCDYLEDMRLDLIAHTELTMPGIYLHNIIIDNLEYGKYKCYASFVNDFNGNDKDIQFNINRDELIGDYSYLYNNKSFTFGLDSLEDLTKESAQKHLNKVKNEISNLSSTSYLAVSVIPNDKLDMNTVKRLMNKYSGQIDIYWIAIATNNPVSLMKDKNELESEIGFIPYVPSVTYNDSPDKNKYPNFFLVDYYFDGLETKISIEEGMSQHFKSLLKYSIDRDDFYKLLNKNEIINKYSNALNYVEKNGVQTYKLYIKGSNDKILDFINNENIGLCEIQNVKVSRYTK